MKTEWKTCPYMCFAVASAVLVFQTCRYLCMLGELSYPYTYIHIHIYVYIHVYTYVYTYRLTHTYAISCRPSNSRYVHPSTHKSWTLLPIRLSSFGQLCRAASNFFDFLATCKSYFQAAVDFTTFQLFQLLGNLHKLRLKVDFGKTATFCPCWRSNSQSDTLTP